MKLNIKTILSTIVLGSMLAMAGCQTGTDKKVDTSKQDIIALQQQAKNMEYTMEELKSKISDLEYINSDLESNVSNLEAEVSDLDSNVSTLMFR